MRSRRILWIAFVAVIALTGLTGIRPAAAVGPEPLDTTAVDRFVSDYLDRHGLAGAGVAVVKDGHVLHTSGYGESGGAPVTSRTSIGVGSVSKSITAFAVLRLVASGKVQLDAPVVSYLPELDIDDDRLSDITVRHLLSHTSGLPDPMIVPPAESLAEDIAHLDDWRLDTDPGTAYSYSNYNYQIAARLVEVVAGTPFEAYLEREVFAPLGMTDTRAVPTGGNDPVLEDGHVTAYGLAFPVREMDAMSAGSGGVISTADDMARWLAMQTAGGRTPDGRVLLPARLLQESRTIQPGAEKAGLGWMHSSPGIEPARVSHSGSLTRFSAQMDLVPSSGYGVVVMLNSFTPTLEHPYEISSGIIEITEGGEPTPGAPVATLIDVALALLTLLAVALTVRGARRSGRWAERRAGWSTWRYGLRLLPHAVFPVLSVYVFGVLPELQDNSATVVDVLFLWPAAMFLLLVLGVSGLALIVARTLARRSSAGNARETPTPAAELTTAG